MATQHRQQPSRLFIPPVMNPQFGNLDTRSMFSPAIGTATQPNFPHHAHQFNPMFPLQTPVQASFFPHPQQPQRPMHPGHRPSQSVAQFNGLGMHHVPMTPLGQQFPPQMMHHGGPPGMPASQPFVPKSRRTPSMIGGPPKALLGGPNRKVSPLPPPATLALEEKLKAKKVAVKIPLENDAAEEEDIEKRSLWSRRPVPSSEFPPPSEPSLPEGMSADIYPEETYRRDLPPTVDVFLPSKFAWDAMRQQEIDEKLEKLGIEPRPELTVPELHAPHARSASISSPADPALLMFKLNRLHQQQSGSGSLSASPQPTSSPGSQFARHGQSMSLAHSPTFQVSWNHESGGVSLDTERENIGVSSQVGIFAPQGRIPAQLSVPPTVSRPESRPDFARGFGLDIPEENEGEEGGEGEDGDEGSAGAEGDDQGKLIAEELELEDHELEASEAGDAQLTTAAESDEVQKAGVHTRHASRVSVALSVGSVSKHLDETMVAHSRHGSAQMPLVINEAGGSGEAEEDVEPAESLNEWTGSEDVRSDEGLDDRESIGEWSNPSDEERARNARLHHRYVRRLQREGLGSQEVPRRIPPFPAPPATRFIPQSDDEDIISNPSDEGHRPMTLADLGMSSELKPMDIRNGASRPLPPLPHSREPSNQYSYYGSLPAHSREPSADHLGGRTLVSAPQPDQAHAKASSLTAVPKKDLNPFAKPFTFGTRLGALTGGTPTSVPASVHSEAASSPAQTNAPTHSRLPSLGTSHMLNASAREFRPSGFTFQPPEGVPKLSFSESAMPTNEGSGPLSETPYFAPSTRASQGREKRQRTSLSIGDSDTDESEYEDPDSMASFKFPRAPEPTMVFNKSAPASISPAANRIVEQLQAAANALEKPATFSKLSGSSPPVLPPFLGHESRSLADTINATEFLSADATRGSVLNDDSSSPILPLPSAQKQKRAPIPLDFKHPVSTNMVPAGLFKNLVNGDAEDRLRSARGQGHSIDFSDARSDISLDDLAMPPISRKVTNRVAKPEDLDVSQDYEDVSSGEEPQSGRSSMGIGMPDSPESQESIVPPNITAYSKGLRLTERVESLLDQKIESLREELFTRVPVAGTFVSSETDELVKEAMAMFRTQLRDSASKGLDDSSMDARGELDFEMVRSIVEQGHEDIRRHIQEDLAAILRNIKESEGSSSPESILDLVRGLQELKANVLAASAHLSQRLDFIESGSPKDRESAVNDVISALRPQLAALRTEPIDYNGLIVQLSQAVRPQITQLIDLASDKRETADLIADRLKPVLQSIAAAPAPIDTGSLVSELTATINRVIAPIDAHNIKEQVADLVVERLSSRLSVRDNDITTSFDSLEGKLAEAVLPLSERFDEVQERLATLASQNTDASIRAQEILSHQANVLRDVPSLLERIDDVNKATSSIQTSLSQQNGPTKSDLERMEVMIEALKESRPSTDSEMEEALRATQRLLIELSPLSGLVQGAMTSHESKQDEILTRLQSVQDAAQELRKLSSANSDLHLQLGKARSQYGQARVEKDNLNERLLSAQADSTRLQAKVEELQKAAMDRTADYAALEARSSEQERAMQNALERLKNSDASMRTQQERISELEKANRELTVETHQLKSKINSLEMKAGFDARDKESAQQALKLLQTDRDHLASQQSHWDELRRTAEQVEMLAAIAQKAESDEIAELKRIRDRAQALEGEHAALQKRLKEQGNKFANLERTAAIARESFGQAQGRATEWEKKAREFEGEVERLTTAVDQGEQTRAQLDADYSLAKLQLDEVGAEKRLAKDRERKLEEEIAALKMQLSEVNSELEEERKVSRAAAAAASQARPSSRASTVYDAPEPPTPRVNGKTIPQSRSRSPITSTWDSMHAPKRPGYAKPQARERQSTTNYAARPPSPTPSTVSVAPTQGDDGWWS